MNVVKSTVIITFICLVTVISDSSARTLDECQLARELLAQGMARNQLNDWVCLVLHESGGNTAAIGGPNSNGSYDYGLFQINDGFWCAHGARGKDCNVECNELLSDDITKSCQCANLIFNRQGFNAWYGWKNYCSGGRAPSVDHCF